MTGNIDLENSRSLIETYLGSLPTINRNETWKDNNVRYPEGKVKTVIEKELETAKNSIYVNYNGNFEYELENRLLLQAIKHVLDIRYTKSIREEEGGTYGVGVWNTSTEYPYESFSLNIKFDCDPEKSEKLITPDKIKKAANILLTQGNTIEIIMKPKI